MCNAKFLFAIAALLTLTGCRSAYISATISNRTSEPLSLVEVDYPSASFGTQTLAPGKDFHYRFKVLGTGPTAVLWTGSTNHEQKNTGPTLKEGDDGQLTITFNSGSSPTWNLQLVNRSPSS
jgi:hypothetical protein